MIADEIRIKYVGGPTALLEVGGLRFLTDPTFDPKDTKYDGGIYILHKLADPSIDVHTIGKIDGVLLSHDHHFDNLDHAGRKLLALADMVYTTPAGAKRLGGNAVGLDVWETIEVPSTDGRILQITSTPCRHGPAGGDRGPVTGFVLSWRGDSRGVVYITGDTVWYEGVEEVATKFDVGCVVLFMGAAVVPQVGQSHLTMTVDEGLKLAGAFPHARIVPLHFEGWEHFTESRVDIEYAFRRAGYGNRLKWAG